MNSGERPRVARGRFYGKRPNLAKLIADRLDRSDVPYVLDFLFVLWYTYWGHVIHLQPLPLSQSVVRGDTRRGVT